MPLVSPPPPRVQQPELIDSVEPPEHDFAAAFGDIARVNRFLGGTRAVVGALDGIFGSLAPSSRPVTMLDLATGSADIPRAIVRAARRGRWGDRTVRVTAADNHPKVLALARRLCQGYPEITVEHADVFALPHADDAFDIVLCSMAFHHFATDGCVHVLREMERIARVGFVVNDLVRDRTARRLIWGLTRLLGANRLTRHDAPLSVLRAFTLPEYEQMVREAGISGCTVRAVPFYRAVIVRSHLESP
uniref:Methyltransferase domain-containing protein n=1 Tax=uncultured Armatimonadetes bacterium TaxID=157466 RepID=A0A6J4ISH9_9BACT|nr:hypothetical protein AVDCRST_MAG63-2390 [uncultured Armatimonadetes bacterium]